MYYDEYDEHDAFEIVDGKPILKDGKAMSISVMLMDSALRDRVTFPTKTRQTPASPVKTFDAENHRPHALAAATDADRERRQKLYADEAKKLSERWKNPPALPPASPQPTRVPSPTAAAEALRLEAARKPATASDLDAAYKRRDAALSQRWRNGGAA